MNHRFCSSALLWIAALLMLITPAAAQSSSADSSPDGFYKEVALLLEGDISEGVILQWVAAQTELPTLSARQILLLKDAGASDRLLTALLGGEVEAAATSAAEPSGEGVETPPAKEDDESQKTAAPAKPTVANDPADAVIPRPSAPPQGAEEETVPVSFRLSSQFESKSDGAPEAFYVYLNGKPLSYVPTSKLLARRDPVTFEQALPVGRYVVRVALEQHQEQDDGGYLHRARFAPEALVFDLIAGRPASVEVRYRVGLVEWGAPLSWSFQQGTIRVDREQAGGDSDRWPSLCSEADASERTGCITWPSLWEMCDPRQEPTTRKDVLRALALFDYRPVPIDS
ncbi:MAG: hypothetical protein AAF481_15265 [Acidobacteriota bacterium]